jgi:hypothetical protein
VKQRAALLVLACVACGAPSSYDGLTGGSIDDESVLAPRPISPLSVSFVATSRPRLKWELGEGLTGAIVELCRTRDCAVVERTFDASGKELVVPEELEPGIWYWRLRGRSDKRRGTSRGPTWEVLVRGPAAHGSSDAPTGSMFDFDGNGIPDLVLATELAYGGMTDATYAIFYGQEDGSFDDRSENGMEIVSPGPGMDGLQYLAGGIDLDGDGFADLVHSGVVDFELFADMGHARETRERVHFIELPTTETGISSIREAGDTNADGYGDLLVGKSQSSFVALGAAAKPGASFASVVLEPKYADLVVQGGAAKPEALPRAVFGCFDANGDGVSDVVTAIQERNVIGLAAAGDRATPFDRARAVPLGKGFASSAAATSFTSGDFDGDGVADLAYAAMVDGSARACITRGDASSLVAAPVCLQIAATGLAAGDLEGDGRDELLAATPDGVRVVRLDGGALVAGAVVPDVTAPLTTIFPGRPGKARWAAAAKDKRGVVIFDGIEPRQRLDAPVDVVGDFVRSLR